MKKGWVKKRIDDLCTLATGGTPTRTRREYFGGEIKWLVSGDIHQKEIVDCQGRITEEGMRNSNAKLLPANSVMIALNGQGKTRGTVALLRTSATCNQSLVCITPKDSTILIPEFLYANLHGRYDELRKITSDDNKDRRGLNMGLIRNIEIPVPSIAEQQRIVAKLDEAFQEIEAARVNTCQNLKNARAIFESELNAIFTKKGEGWQDRKLSSICREVTVGHVGQMAKEYRDEGIPFLRSQNIRPYHIDLKNVNYIDKEFNSLLKKSQLQPGDLAIVRTGYPGTAAVIPPELPESNCSDLVIVRPKDDVNPYFLEAFFNSAYGKRLVLGRLVGAAQKHFNVTAAKEVVLHLPRNNEQSKIVKMIHVLRSETQHLESIYQRKLSELDALKKSLLHHAFTGNL